MLQKFFDFLLGLKNVTLSDWNRLRFGFAVDWPRILIVLFCIVLFALGYWSYRKQSASPNKRMVMGFLRGLALVFVFLLVCRPQLVLDYTEPTASVVAVWVDASASMTLEDPYKDADMVSLVKRVSTAGPLPSGQTRANRYQLAIDHLEHAAWLREAVKHQHVAFFTGGASPQRVGTVMALQEGQDVAEKLKELDARVAELRKIKPDATSTDVPTVVARINDSVTRSGQRVSGIVLLTDGQTTTGSRPDLAVAELTRARSGGQVFPIAVGQPDPPLDLRIASMQVPPGVFARDPVVVKVKLKWSGLDRATQVKVTLDRVGEQAGRLAEQQIDLQKTTGDKIEEKEIELIFKPEKKAKAEKSETYNLVAKVEAVGALPGEELALDNNQSRGSLKVYDAEMNILYVEGYPRWEYRYLKNELIRESTVNIATLLLSADPENQAEGDKIKRDANGKILFGPVNRFPETAEEIEQFDVILIGDVEPTFFSPAQMKLIADHVRLKGAGLGWIAGPSYNPDSYATTPLADFLPIIPDDPNRPSLTKAENVGFVLSPTAQGKDSNLFRFFDSKEKNIEQLKNLPELYWFKPVLNVKPGAEILAEHPTRMQGGAKAPLLVTVPVGKGRVVFSAICDTWRWRRYTGEPLFQTYWLQMARLLFQDRQMQMASRRAILTSPGANTQVDREIIVALDVKDPTLNGPLGNRVRVNIKTRRDRRPVDSIELVRKRDDRLEGHVTLHDAGEYSATLDLPGAGEEIDPLELTVQPPSGEFEELKINSEALTLLASKTGGKSNTLLSAEELVKQIPDRSEQVLRHRGEELWYKPLALALALALLTAEWLVRKSAGLI